MESSSAGTVRRGSFTYFPVVPGRIEFSWRVRRYLLERRPSVIAVELPVSLEPLYVKAVSRLPEMSVILVEDSRADEDEDESATYHPVEPGDPFVEAMRTAAEIGASVVFLEPASQAGHRGNLHPRVAYAEPYAVETLGMDRYVEAYRVHARTRTPAMEVLAAAMAWKVQGADPFAETCIVVSLGMLDALLDAMDIPQDEPPAPPVRLFGGSQLYNLHPDCLAEVTVEAPYFQEKYEQIRTGLMEGFRLNRPEWQLSLLRDAEKEYVINTGEQVQSWQRVGLAKFSRNLALLERALIPDLYDLTLAGRSLVDDNFAYEVWQMGNRFPIQQTEAQPFETINISGEEVWLNTRKLHIRRRLPRMKQRMRPARLPNRKREKFKGEWASQTDGNAICSYPPEDIVIESYGRFLKKYARTAVSEGRSRVEPFTTSLLDGIDIRETLRHWHEGKLFVRELSKFSGEVGAVVIIFDEDRQNRYTYLTTWLGEHQNESDMAFYSTHPFEHLVGPGIGRAEYGGLLMTLPPRRLFDVWNDLDYEAAESKAERLLMAALDYSVEQHVVYVAARPPRSHFRQLASRLNRKIIYVPLGQLSPSKLKKIRVLHVLDSRERRQDAKEYIW